MLSINGSKQFNSKTGFINYVEIMILLLEIESTCILNFIASYCYILYTVYVFLFLTKETLFKIIFFYFLIEYLQIETYDHIKILRNVPNCQDNISCHGREIPF